MTYEEIEKQEAQARETVAGKLAEAAEILGYKYDAKQERLNPPDEYFPTLYARFCDYRTRDKIEISSYAERSEKLQKCLATIRVSQSRSAASIAQDIKRRAIDAVKEKLHEFHQEEQKRLAKEAAKRQELTELFAAYSESGYKAGHDGYPISKDNRLEIRKYGFKGSFTINAEVNSKYALLQIIKILKEDAK